jgi:hypothetical protein
VLAEAPEGMTTAPLGGPSGMTANLWLVHPKMRLLKRCNSQNVFCTEVRALRAADGQL